MEKPLFAWLTNMVSLVYATLIIDLQSKYPEDKGLFITHGCSTAQIKLVILGISRDTGKPPYDNIINSENLNWI